MTERLTQADYDLQCAELEALLTGAQQHHNLAAYRKTIGEATQDDVDKAFVHLEAVKAQRRQLDGAWEATKIQAAAEKADARRADQQAVIDMVEGKIKTRLAAARKMEKFAKELAEQAVIYREAGEAVVVAVKPMYDAGVIRQDDFQFIMSDARDSRHLRMIAGLLFNNGLDMSMTNPGNDRFELERQGGVMGLVERTNSSLRQRCAAIEPGAVA
ncbi:hypothetical protein [Sphingobium xenophagum]|uniref:hypothetical protein n=1 Tax=Sphingobium xenophagum TaxID=121428 RepID=UPI000364A779|nr:hypothetical protein [Sphingobium xenophagum]